MNGDRVSETLHLSQLMNSHLRNVQVLTLYSLVLSDHLAVLEDLVGERFESGASIFTIKLYTKVLILTARIVTCRQKNAAHAVVLIIVIFVKLSDYR